MVEAVPSVPQPVPPAKVVRGFRAKVRLVVPKGPQSTIIRLLIDKYGEWIPYEEPSVGPSLGIDFCWATRKAARAYLKERRGFTKGDVRLVRILRKQPLGWAIGFRIPETHGRTSIPTEDPLTARLLSLATGEAALRGTPPNFDTEWGYLYESGWTKADALEAAKALIKERGYPFAIYKRLRKRFCPVYAPVLAVDSLRLKLEGEPPGYFLSKVCCRIVADGSTLAEVETFRRGGETPDALAERGKAAARLVAKESREALASSAAAASGTVQSPSLIPRGTLRTVYLWKRGTPPRTVEKACTDRRRFATYKAGYAAAMKSQSLGRGRMQVQPCGVCHGFHLARWRPGKDGNTHPREGGAAAPGPGGGA